MRESSAKNAAMTITNLSDLLTISKTLKDCMYAKNINPAEVNVNGEMIASVNYFFFALQNVHLKQNDEEYRKQKHNNLNSLNERASKKKERKK